jgi:hypothetical protein
LANMVGIRSESMPRNVHNFVFKSDIGDGVFLLEQSADWNRAKMSAILKFKVGESISTLVVL